MVHRLSVPLVILLAGDRALVIGVGRPTGPRSSGPAPSGDRPPEPPRPTLLALVDVSDPDEPTLLSAQRDEAELAGAWLTGATVRVATTHPTALSAPPARHTLDRRGEWSHDTSTRCTDVLHTAGASRPGMLTVQTLNLARDDAFRTADSFGVVGATQAYQAPPACTWRPLRVAPGSRSAYTSSRQARWPRPRTRAAHASTVTCAARTRCRSATAAYESSSTRNPGRSARAASCAALRATPGPARLDVLDVGGGDPRVVGGAGRLLGTSAAATVRWMDDLALVGSDQTLDPLLVVDLSDPERPEPAAELETDGYDSYVQPLGRQRYLTLGALPGGKSEDGEPLHMGMQIAGLHLDDPSDPERTDSLDYGIGYHTDVAYDAGRGVAYVVSLLDTGDVCPAGEYCTSGGDQVPQNCRPVSSCSGFTGPASIPMLLAIRAGTDGTVTESGRWTGEVHTVVPLGDRVAVVDYGRITLADPVSLQATGTLVTNPRALEPNTDDFYPLPKRK